MQLISTITITTGTDDDDGDDDDDDDDDGGGGGDDDATNSTTTITTNSTSNDYDLITVLLNDISENHLFFEIFTNWRQFVLKSINERIILKPLNILHSQVQSS